MKSTTLSSLLILALSTLLPSALHALPAFPGAEGWGTQTPGGRGGNVILVTNTNSTGAGSLTAALSVSGPKIIVFRTSGVINLNFSGLSAGTSFMTLAGQTSPGGVTLTSNSGAILESYRTGFHDAVFRFIRVRGNDNTYDNLSFNTVYNIVVDHCDFSGSSDECFDICSSRDFTVQWTTIVNSSSCSNCQTYGSLHGYAPTSQITMHHNLWAHHVNRSPYFHWLNEPAINNGQIDFRNNISYDGVDYFLVLGLMGGPIHINIVNNYFKAGPNTSTQLDKPLSISGQGVMYETGNVWNNRSGQVSSDIVNMWSTPQRVASAWPLPAVATLTANQAYDTVLNQSGAWPRDAMNTRTVSEVRNRTGILGKDDDGKITTGPASPADADNDGMPDFWEDGVGLDKNSASDNIQDKDGDGYTNIEEYINDLALARLCQGYYNPVYPIPSDWPDYNPGCSKYLEAEQSAGPGLKTRSLTVSPNPYTGGTLTVELPGRAALRGNISIVDAAGRIVAQWPASQRTAWDGGAASHSITPAGVYLVRWEAAGKMQAQKKFILVR